MTIRIVLIGASGVGKSAIATQFGYKYFREGTSSMTVGVDVQIGFAGTTRVMLWDTSGRPTWSGLIPGFLGTADVVFIVFDTEATLATAVTWARTVPLHAKTDTPVFLIHNKTDVAIVPTAQKTADGLKLPLRYVSATDGQSIEDAMVDAIKLVPEKIPDTIVVEDTPPEKCRCF